MPTRELAAYAEALPAIEAQRSLAAVSATAVGAGTMKKGPRDELLGAWRAQLRRFTPASRPRTTAALQLAAAGSGFAVRPLKRKAPPDA